MMNLKRVSRNVDLIRHTLLRLSSTSVETVSKKPEEHYEKELKEFQTLTNITKRTRQKKPQRPPFIKNLMVGVFDTEILTFPELENDEVKNLEKVTGDLERLLKQKHMVNVNSLSNTNFRQNLSDIRAIGLQASQFLDGRESTPLEVMKYLEIFAGHNLGDNLIYNEQLGIQTLVKYASDAIKKKYLYYIMKGEKLPAFCVVETNIIDTNNISTRATLSEDQKYWILNGTKSFVVNGVSADHLIVFAVSSVITKETSKQVKLTAFLVEKEYSGVSWTKLESCDTEIAEIVFQNTKVPIENVIGEVHKGEEILNSILSDFRLSCGPACITLSRNILNNLLKTVLQESTNDLMLYKTEAIRHKLGQMAMNLYAAESVTYLTAGIQDWYENPDTAIESAIVKVLSSETAYKCSTDCLDLIGLPATLKNHWARKLHEKAINYMTIHETNDSQRMFMALTGLQHAGVELAEKIRKIRNPLYHGAFILGRVITNRKNVHDNPTLDLGLNYYLHPSLAVPALHLEYCAKRLEFGTEKVLARYGLEVTNKHVDLRRLADAMIDCYAMTAVLARASRSYCIGLQNSAHELVLASAFCLDARKRVRKNIRGFYDLITKNQDDNLLDVGKQITKSKEYFVKNALTRNF